MMISTRGRYALRVMIDLAEHPSENYQPMKYIAERQQISLKYLERILPALARNGMLSGVHGKGGGYKLIRHPSQCSVGEILRLAEGELTPVVCQGCGPEPCDNYLDCRTRPLWQGLNRLVNDYLDGISLADLMKKPEQAETDPLD